MRTPLLWSSKVAQIGEKEVNLECVFSLEVVWLNIDLRSEKNDIIDFNLLLTVSNEECLGHEACLFIYNLGRHQIMMVWSVLLGSYCLLLLVVRNV